MVMIGFGTPGSRPKLHERVLISDVSLLLLLVGPSIFYHAIRLEVRL